MSQLAFAANSDRPHLHLRAVRHAIMTPPPTNSPAAYHQRWAQETGNDQLKPISAARARCCGPGCPTSSTKKIWSYLIVHHAISDLIARASDAADLDPDRISFAKALRLPMS